MDLSNTYFVIVRYDCQGFFTEGIWAGILLGLVIAMMLANVITADALDALPSGQPFSPAIDALHADVSVSTL